MSKHIKRFKRTLFIRTKHNMSIRTKHNMFIRTKHNMFIRTKHNMSIRTKHNMHVFGVTPFINYKMTLEQQLNRREKTNNEKWDGELIKPLVCFRLSCVLFLSLAIYYAWLFGPTLCLLSYSAPLQRLVRFSSSAWRFEPIVCHRLKHSCLGFFSSFPSRFSF